MTYRVQIPGTRARHFKKFESAAAHYSHGGNGTTWYNKMSGKSRIKNI